MSGWKLNTSGLQRTLQIHCTNVQLHTSQTLGGRKLDKTDLGTRRDEQKNTANPAQNTHEQRHQAGMPSYRLKRTMDLIRSEPSVDCINGETI